jgi:hypothetical protein
MPHYVHFGIAFLIGLVITLTYGYYRRKKKTHSSMEDQVEYPKIARVEIHPYCCNTCGKPLEHNDLVVWSEKKNGWQSKSSHAECVVFIRHPEGHITHLNGEMVKIHSSGGIVDPLPIGSLLLTEDEWDNWAPPKTVKGVRLNPHPSKLN